MKTDWEKLFKSQILKRGYAYYQDGAVTDLTRDEKSITAKVRGSETYHVDIMMPKGFPQAMYCDCPFAAGGESCKHMAAVLYAASETEEMPAEKKADWEASLEILPEPTLRKLVHSIAVSDGVLQSKLLRMASGGGDRKQWKADLKQILRSHMGRDKYIAYEDAYDCMTELTEYLNDILPELLQAGAVADAAALTELVYKTAFEQDMDDSDGGLSQVSFYCEEAWRNILQLATEKQTTEIFASLHKLIETAEWVYGVSDLENVILSLEWPPVLQEKHLAWLDANLDWKRLKDRVALMQKMGADDTAVIQFLEQHRTYDTVYSMLLPLYEKTDIHRAIQLAEEHRAENPKKWQYSEDTKKLIELLDKAGETERYIRELRYLVLEYGCLDVEYAARLKAVTDSGDWENVFFTMLNAAKYTEQRLALLVFEKMYDTLLMELSECQHLSIFLSYESILREQYPQQALDIYIKLLQAEMEYASDRKGYQRIVAHLKKLESYPGGKESAMELAKHWYSVHNNRPAMKDELRKAGYVR